MSYNLKRLQDVLKKSESCNRNYTYGSIPYIKRQEKIKNLKKAIAYVKKNPYVSITSICEIFEVRLNRYKPLNKRVVRPKKDNGVKFKVCTNCDEHLRIKSKGMCGYCYDTITSKKQYSQLTPADLRIIYAKRKVMA